MAFHFVNCAPKRKEESDDGAPSAISRRIDGSQTPRQPFLASSGAGTAAAESGGVATARRDAAEGVGPPPMFVAPAHSSNQQRPESGAAGQSSSHRGTPGAAAAAVAPGSSRAAAQIVTVPATAAMLAAPAGPGPAPAHVPPNAMLVNHNQRGNRALTFIRNVRYMFAEIAADYQLNDTTACLFLSLKFHKFKPEYIHGRIKALLRAYRIFIVCHVDVDDPAGALGEVMKTAINNKCTLLCGWSPLECARVLETLKAFESKPADLIMPRVEKNTLSRWTAALTKVRGVNSTDVLTLGGRFRTMAAVFQADLDSLSSCRGLGPTKVKRLFEALHQPFLQKTPQRPAPQLPVTPAASSAPGGSGALTWLAPAPSAPAPSAAAADAPAASVPSPAPRSSIPIPPAAENPSPDASDPEEPPAVRLDDLGEGLLVDDEPYDDFDFADDIDPFQD